MKLNCRLYVFLLLFMLIAGCKQKVNIKNISGGLLNVDSTLVADTLIADYIDPFSKDIDKQMNRIIGYSDKELVSYFPESPLSNFIADIIQERALVYLKANNAEPLPLITLMNIRGIRASLPKGDITVRNIFEIMPFENQIVVLTLPGKAIEEFFEHISATNGEGISGARLEIMDKKIKKLTIGGKPLDVNSNYYLATSDYLANGGDYFSMIVNPLHREMIGCKIREAIIQYIEGLTQKGEKAISDIDGRVKVI